MVVSLWDEWLNQLNCHSQEGKKLRTLTNMGDWTGIGDRGKGAGKGKGKGNRMHCAT